MFAAAVLLVASLRTMAMAVERAVSAQSELAPVREVIASPSALATPVSNISVPRLSPPPKRRIVPQSIFTASGQVRVNSPLRRLVGRTKSKTAASNAAADADSALAHHFAGPKGAGHI